MPSKELKEIGKILDEKIRLYEQKQAQAVNDIKVFGEVIKQLKEVQNDIWMKTEWGYETKKEDSVTNKTAPITDMNVSITKNARPVTEEPKEKPKKRRGRPPKKKEEVKAVAAEDERKKKIFVDKILEEKARKMWPDKLILAKCFITTTEWQNFKEGKFKPDEYIVKKIEELFGMKYDEAK